MRPGRNRKVGAAFLLVWMVFWTAGILVALWTLGAAALAGELGAGLVLAVWLAAAGFGLYAAGRNLMQLLVTGRPQRPNTRRWEDGIDPPGG